VRVTRSVGIPDPQAHPLTRKQVRGHHKENSAAKHPAPINFRARNEVEFSLTWLNFLVFNQGHDSLESARPLTNTKCSLDAFS
jgi:hypothetical protein